MTNNKDRVDMLLHSKECPVGYRCKAPDCIECMRLHREGKEAVQK